MEESLLNHPKVNKGKQLLQPQALQSGYSKRLVKLTMPFVHMATSPEIPIK